MCEGEFGALSGPVHVSPYFNTIPDGETAYLRFRQVPERANIEGVHEDIVSCDEQQDREEDRGGSGEKVLLKYCGLWKEAGDCVSSRQGYESRGQKLLRY